MLRKGLFKEVIVTAAERIDLPEGDFVVGIAIKNQGSTNVKTSMNSDSGVNLILPNTSEGYGGMAGYILTGFLSVNFEGTGDNQAIVKIFTDKGCLE